MTGIRLWIGRMKALGSDVIIVQDSTTRPSVFDCQCSQRPAKAKGRWSLRWISVFRFLPSTSGHSKKPSAGTRQRRDRKASRKDGFSSSVSVRALNRFISSRAQRGMRPQRNSEISRSPVCSLTRSAGTALVGKNSGRLSTATGAVRPNISATMSALLVSR
jgi:hypothetical protein